MTSTATRSHEPTTNPPTPAAESAATIIEPLLTTLLGGDVPLRIELWDGSSLGPDTSPATIRLHSAEAVRHLLWAPGELGLARAYVSGALTADGDLITGIAALRGASVAAKDAPRILPEALHVAREFGVTGRPRTMPRIEARPQGRRHSRRRDATAIGHHYDVSNEFYRLVLGESMTYSCARFTTPESSLETAQASKHELICRKLGLAESPGRRLLDIGCGWGSMAIHAAKHHGAHVVGATLSAEQAAFAREAVSAAGVDDLVEIRQVDYRELRGERFDAVSSVGMFEHVGASRADEYFLVVRSVLGPHGRFLNHAISSVGGSKLPRRSFMARYIFPDGELHDVGDVVLRMERAGFEVRDVESLREHYAKTLQGWIANLERGWESAVVLVGSERARAWHLYMAGSVVGFTDGGINLHQVLGVVADADGNSAMPATRDGWATAT